MTSVTMWLAFLPSGRVEASEPDPIGVTERRLPNGLTVLLTENHQRAEVFGAVVVDVGSKNDPADNTGMAHYLEHMLFKGTSELGTSDWDAERPFIVELEKLYDDLAATDDPARRRDLTIEIDVVSQKAARFAIPNEFDRLVAELGGTNVNAFTTQDVTVYHNAFPASQIEAWLEVQAHRFERPVFRLFGPELEAVYEEKNASMDGFVEPAFDTFLENFYPGHPYGRPVLGSVEHLRRPSLRAMREHHERWYVANNMALVLSGDFDTEAILPIIEEKFGRWRSADLPDKSTPTVAPFRGQVRVDVRLSPVRAGALGFRTPARGEPDYAALLVARRLLSNAQGSGRLDRLVDAGKLLFADVLEMDMHEHDAMVVFFAPKILGQTFGRAESLVRGELDRIRDGRVPESEVVAVRRNLSRDLQRQWESNEARALAMADTWARGRSWSDYLDFVAEVDAIAVADVARAARKWLGADHLAMRSRRGKPDRTRLPKPSFTPVRPVGGRHSEYYRRIHPTADDDVAPRFVDLERALVRAPVTAGVELVSNANPFNSIHRLELRFGVGRRDIPALDTLGDYLLRAGTTLHRGPEFSARLFEIATTMHVYATDDRFVIALEGPEARISEAIELVAELMATPASDRRRRRRMRLESWAAHRIARSEPSEIAGALWEHAVHGDDAYGHRYGHRASRRHSVADLLDAWSQAQQYEVQVRHVGRRAPVEVAELLAQQVPWSTQLRAAKPERTRPLASAAADQVYFVKRRDAVQTHVWFFVRGDDLDRDQAVGMDAYNEYMGGEMGGLIFQEIRELRALAYTAIGAWPEPEIAGAPGYFYGYVACQADKTEETIRLMRELLGHSPDRSDRLAAVRSSLLRSQEAADPPFRELQPTIAMWRDQGYTDDPRRERIRGYRQLSVEQMQAFWSAQIEGRPLVLMVVGDPRRVEIDVLERFGPVTVVPRRKLYDPVR